MSWWSTLAMALIAVIIADEFRTLKAANLKMSGEIAVLNERLNEAEARADDFEHRARGLNRLSEAEKKITEHDHQFSTMETELKVATAIAMVSRDIFLNKGIACQSREMRYEHANSGLYVPNDCYASSLSI